MTEALKFVEDETRVRLETAKNIKDFLNIRSVTLMNEFAHEVTG